MEKLITIIVSVGFISVMMFTTHAIRYWIHKQRHLFRQKIRDKYIVREPQKFLSWSSRLSLIEIKYFSRVLDGEHIIERLNGVLTVK